MMGSGVREIPGFPGYFASRDGRILSRRTGVLRELAPRANRDGHLRVNVRMGVGRETQRTRYVHRLVLRAFRGPPPDGCTHTRHLNGDPADNRLANLTWGTPAENIRDSVRHGTAVGLRRGEAAPASQLTEAQVLEIEAAANAGADIGELAELHGITAQHAGAIRDHKTWRHLWS